METDDVIEAIDYAKKHGCRITALARNQLAALLAEVARLRDRVDDLTAAGIHSCGPGCRRPACVVRRERDALTPKWLPAGNMPDAEGLWLWWRHGGTIDPIQSEIYHGEMTIHDTGSSFKDLAHPDDRFARLPDYTPPTEDAR